MTHYAQATIEQATRLSLEHELRNGNTTLTTPELSELREGGFLSKASREREHAYTRKEITHIMSGQQAQPFKAGLGRYVEAARTRNLTDCLNVPDTVTCTNITFKEIEHI